jgi:hypothetical protein
MAKKPKTAAKTSKAKGVKAVKKARNTTTLKTAAFDRRLKKALSIEPFYDGPNAIDELTEAAYYLEWLRAIFGRFDRDLVLPIPEAGVTFSLPGAFYMSPAGGASSAEADDPGYPSNAERPPAITLDTCDPGSVDLPPSITIEHLVMLVLAAQRRIKLVIERLGGGTLMFPA